jgi:xylose isomerase
MDVFARSLLTATDILENSNYKNLRKARYSSFNTIQGKEFESGKMDLATLAEIAHKNDEPSLRSGQQELFENIINNYI